MTLMASELVIEDLRKVAKQRNALDPEVLLRIQEDLAMQVMQEYRQDFKKLLDEQRRTNMPEDQARHQRHAFFYAKLNQEYRNRAANGGQFSLPMYVEAAESYYRLEIRRLMQQVHDYVAHASRVAEEHLLTVPRDMRSADHQVDDLSRAVAGGINKIMSAVNRMSSLGDKVSQKASAELKSALDGGFFALSGDSFAKMMIHDIQLRAEADRELVSLQSNNRRPS